MTELMVTVTSRDEATAAVAAGATIVDARAGGRLAALPRETVRAIAGVGGGRVVATAGPDASLNDLIDLADVGAGAVNVFVPSGEIGAALVTQVGRALARKTQLVAVLDAAAPDVDLVPIAAVAGFAGIQFDTGDDEDAGLLGVRKLPDIAHLVAAARRAKLSVGLGGGLRIVDIGTLLPLKPDWLRFRAAACEDETASRPLDPARVRALATALAVHDAHLRDATD